MADYEIVKPTVDLRRKVKVLPGSSDFDPVAKAEQALQRLSVNFDGWMKEEVGKLQMAWDNLSEQGLSEETLKRLFLVAHDIRGQAHTMKYPIAGAIAGTLCDLIEQVPNRAALPKDILQKHVQAIAAIVNEGAREEDNVLGKTLAKELSGISAEIIEKVGEKQE
ncbi:Hpt domain-containing protein [Cohaesibacter celericrescens]|uniref:Histidine kinase n=1 Tax=Cohaesibacter celericrescens TaxID=2067669 RepID=A0A2N5XW29_9HYPH|nr:Hpt domain-containing protein [Cohaesibacter celericrescens]PLW78704.1 histidine kinase [Cohaesibacter celericrescens]